MEYLADNIPGKPVSDTTLMKLQQSGKLSPAEVQAIVAFGNGGGDWKDLKILEGLRNRITVKLEEDGQDE